MSALVPLDKRDVCGCHRDCSWMQHECAVPCVWPNCLTDEDHDALAAALVTEVSDYDGEAT